MTTAVSRMASLLSLLFIPGIQPVADPAWDWTSATPESQGMSADRVEALRSDRPC